MKIDIEQNSAYEETAVTIRCAGLSREVMELLALLLDAGNGEAARQLAADHLDWLDEYDAALADRADIVAHNEALPSVRRRNLLDGIAFLRALAALAQRTVGEALAFANAAEGEAVAV